MSDVMDMPEDDMLAAEYVLRLLDDVATRDAERRMGTDTLFRGLVHMWESHFVGIAAQADDIAPPAAVKTRVMAAIAPKTAPRRRGFGLFAGLALVAVLAVVLLTPILRGPGPFVPEYEAAMVSQTGDLVITAGFVPDENLLIVSRTAGTARPGRVIELWLIADGAPGPVSLGVLPDEPEAVLSVSAEVATALPGGTLAVSDEPPGGSTTGAPTGDVLAAAPVTEL